MNQRQSSNGSPEERVPIVIGASHYAMLACASLTWLAALRSDRIGEDWFGHRVLGVGIGLLVSVGWITLLRHGRFGLWLRGWRHGLAALRALILGHGPVDELSDRVLRLLIPLGLMLASLVVLSGLPSLVRLDGVLHPAAWVTVSRTIHKLSADALMTLWSADLVALWCIALRRLGRGEAVRPST